MGVIGKLRASITRGGASGALRFDDEGGGGQIVSDDKALSDWADEICTNWETEEFSRFLREKLGPIACGFH